MATINYKHLHYFWQVATTGSVVAAAERLGVSPQTISGQLATLEQDMGRALLQQVGRRLVLTEAGREALRYADEIFLLGEQLREAMVDPGLGGASRLTVGIADSVPKLVAYQLLAPILAATPQLRLVCHEGEYDELVSALSRHKLDLVLSDRDLGHAPPRSLVSKQLASCPIGIFAVRSLLGDAALQGDSNRLQHAPMLLPSKRSSLRSQIDNWLAAERLQPTIVGEFDDSALLTTFGGNGAGFFPAATVLAPMLARQYEASLVTVLPDISEQYFGISTRAKLPNQHIVRLFSGGNEA